MLYVSRTPVKVELMEDRKIILLTANKILFTHLDFIQEYLSMPLIGANPKKFIHPPSSLQTLVQTETTIEIYYCDWKTQIKLVKVIILTNQDIHSIYYDQKSGWHIFGSMFQYEPARITFHQAYPKAPNQTICECEVAKNRFRLTSDQLLKSQKGQNFQQIRWKDRMMVLKNTNYYIKMQAEQSLDKTREILCLNSTYILVISKYEVLYMIMEPIVKIFSNNLIVSTGEDGKFTTVIKMQDRSYTNLGTIYSQNGQVQTAFIYQEELVLLNYYQHSLTVTTIGLVKNESSPRNANLPKNKFTYQLKNSISKIIEQPHEQASQFIQQQQREEEKQKNMYEEMKKVEKSGEIKKNGNKTKDTTTKEKVENKPIIRDIQVSDDEIKDNSLNEEDSQVLSRSAIDNDKQSEDRQKQFDDNLKLFASKRQVIKRKNVKNHQLSRHHSSNDNNYPSLPKQEKDSSNNEMNESDLPESLQKVNKSFKSISGISQKSKNRHNISVNQESFTDEPLVETPAFGLDNNAGLGGWGTFENNWDAVVSNQISQRAQMQQIEEEEMEEKQKMKKSAEVISKKVQYFLDGRQPTRQLIQSIEGSTYCRLIEKVLQDNPDKFEEITKQFLLNILQQPQANLFFADHIRTYSPQFTKDKIKRIFHELLDKQIYRPMLTKVLQQFKLSEVPNQMLSFPTDFINVIKILYKDIYISDLLEPSEVTIQYLLQSYFNMTSFSQEIITIEDEQIQIAHPRNMLNVLLYLNQVFNLHISVILQVYCSKLLRYNCLQVIAKLIDEDVFQICEVPRTMLDQPIIDRYNELLRESVENASYVWQLIPFMTDDISDEYRITLATITELNANNILFDLQKILNIKQSYSYLFEFLENIIQQNSCSNLMNLKFDTVYRSLYWIQEGEKLMNYTHQYVDLMKQLATKFISKRYIYDGFHVLDNIASEIHLSFVAGLIYKYLDGKLLNRLAKMGKHHANLESMFPQYFQTRDIDFRKIPRDHLQIPKVSQSFSCSWDKFKTIYDTYLSGPSQLQYLTFLKVNIVYQIYLTLEEEKKQKFNRFISDIGSYLIVALQTMNQMDESLNPRGLTPLKFYQKIGEDLQSNAGTSMMIREDYLLDVDDSNKKKMYKSMTIIDHYNDVNQRRISRANSDKKKSIEIFENEELGRLKFLVDKKEIRTCLEQIYQTQPAQVFVKATHLVDLQKIPLSHIDTFKYICSKKLQFQLSKIIPFEIFFTEDENEAFEKSRKRVKSQLGIKNFWLIFMIIQMMFGKGSTICQMFMEELVQNYNQDKASQFFKDILKTVGGIIPIKFLKSIRNRAKQNKLNRTYMEITKYIDENKL